MNEQLRVNAGDPFAERVIAMGGDSKSVHVVGAFGLETVQSLPGSKADP